MDLREYMSVRRAYNVVRQRAAAEERLTFEELAILCHLIFADAPMKTSAIAEYQGALRPTMTHRTNHLARLGLIDRTEGSVDRRNVVCAISEAGRACVATLSERTRSQIPSGRSLSRTSAERICRYVDAMGSFFCRAGDLVLLGLISVEGEPQSITQLVDLLGLLQPTVSMSVSSLVEEGLVTRLRGASGGRTACVALTPEGEDAARALAGHIEGIIVRRRMRGPRREKGEA